jgi:hypothetical protein
MTRDFIPEGEELTGEEKARFGLREQDAGIQRPNDFLPAEGSTFEDKTREEKEQFARDAAVASVARRNAVMAAEADRKLKDLNGPQAVDFLRTLSPADRDTYLRAEKDGLNREEVFKAYGEPQSDEPRTEGEVVPFGAVKGANRDSERKEFEQPVESTAPSDRLHRAIRQAQAGQDVDDESLTTHEEASVKASADLDEHYPGDPDNDGLIEEDIFPPHVDPEDAKTVDYAAINEAKARKAAEGEEVTPDNDKAIVKEAQKEAEEADAESEGDGRAAETGPQQDEARQGEEQPEATKPGATPASAEDVAAGEVSSPGLEPLPKEEAKKVKAQQKKAATKKAPAKKKKETS